MPFTDVTSDGGTGLSDGQLDDLRDALNAEGQISYLAGLMNAAGNRTRMRILYLLWRGKEVRVNDLAKILDLSTPAISQQLKKLRAHSLVKARREAQTVYYRLNTDHGMVTCVTWFFSEGGFPMHGDD